MSVIMLMLVKNLFVLFVQNKISLFSETLRLGR